MGQIPHFAGTKKEGGFDRVQHLGQLYQLFWGDLDLPGLVHGGVDLLGPAVVPEQVKPRERIGELSQVSCSRGHPWLFWGFQQLQSNNCGLPERKKKRSN